LGTGLLAGINLARRLSGEPIAIPPATTMLGGLYRYLAEADPKHFQPMNANFGLLDPLPGKLKKDRKKELLVERAQADFGTWIDREGLAATGGASGTLQHSTVGARTLGS
jgi:methylenetetrahydrofolate--tRNA-(uracil-5-)-methyltransferase